MKRFLLSSFGILTILLIGCERNTTPLLSLNPKEPAITSNEYEWEIDTLQAPGAWQTSMMDIWGTDENNVYVVGHSDDYLYQAYHWDGSNWTPIDLRFPGHPSSLSEIYGFSETDIWAVGDEVHGVPINKRKDFIVHYDGADWELIKNVDAPVCLSVWGTSSNNLFVGCDSGVVLHYDGSAWEKQYTNSQANIVSIFGFNFKTIYAVGNEKDKQMPVDTSYYYFFKYYNGSWQTIDSAKRTIVLEPFKFGSSDLWGQNGTLYSIGYGLYLFQDKSWIPILNENIGLISIHGNNLNDIFAVGLFGYIFHFNGVEWYQYTQFKDRFIDNSGVWMHGDYVFIIGQPDRYSVILRGKRRKGGGAL